MAHKITLPLCGLEVELAVWPWEKSRSFFDKAAEFLKQDKSREDWMEHCLREDYPAETLDKVFRNSPDAVDLYNETLRYNKYGQDHIKNSLRSGTGDQTRTD